MNFSSPVAYTYVIILFFPHFRSVDNRIFTICSHLVFHLVFHLMECGVVYFSLLGHCSRYRDASDKLAVV